MLETTASKEWPGAAIPVFVDGEPMLFAAVVTNPWLRWAAWHHAEEVRVRAMILVCRRLHEAAPLFGADAS